MSDSRPDAWRTMESAPRIVSQLILIWDEDVSHPVVGNWSAEHECYVTDFGGQEPGTGVEIDQYRIAVATHWMPLPGEPEGIWQYR